MLDKNKIIQILEKYNYWENSPKSIGYIRENYINKILSSFDNIDLIKVLIGQRRVGKSYIIKQNIFDGYIGKKLENYVFTYFKQKGYNIYVGNIASKEIDFICEKDNKKIYLQVAYLLASEDVIEREYGNLRKINDSFPKYVISLDDIKMPIDNYGIEYIRVWELDL